MRKARQSRVRRVCERRGHEIHALQNAPGQTVLLVEQSLQEMETGELGMARSHGELVGAHQSFLAAVGEFFEIHDETPFLR